MAKILGRAGRRNGRRSAAAAAAACLIVLLGWTGAAAQFVKDTDGGGYKVTHDAAPSQWSAQGTRGAWTTATVGGKTGVAAPDESNNAGFLILNTGAGSNSHTCSDDGTYTVTYSYAEYPNANSAAIVFRYTGTSNFYAIRVRYNYGNNYHPILFSKNVLNSGDQKAGEQAIGSAFTSDGNITLKVEMIGETIKVYRDGALIGTIADTDNTKGQVGYAQAGVWQRGGLFISSAWRDTNTAQTIPAGFMAWNTVAGNSITPGSGDWGDAKWSFGSTDVLATWTNSSSALFAGPDPTGSTTYAIAVGTAAPTVANMDFQSNGYVISGGTVTATSAGGGITVAAGKTATINSVIAGTAVTKSGAGTLVLGGANTYTGTTTVSAGVLQIGSSGSAAGGGTGSLSGSISVATGAEVVFSRSGAVAQNGISGAGSLTKQGSGTLTLSNGGSYTGAVTVSAGTLEVTVNAASNLGSGTVAVGAGRLSLNVTGTQSFSRAVSGTTGSVFEKTGTGTLNVTAANGVAADSVKVSAGKLGGTAQVGRAGAVITASAGGTLAGGRYTGNVTLSGGVLENTGADSTLITGTLAMAGTAPRVDLSINPAAKNAHRVFVSGALTLGAGATLNITNALTDDHVGEYQIIKAGSSTGNFSNILVGQEAPSGYELSTTASGGTVTLKIAKSVNPVRNPLTVADVKFVGESGGSSTVEVTVSGFNALRAYNEAGDPRIDGIYIWYRPGAAASESDTTSMGGKVRIAATFPTGDALTFTIPVKGSDTLYFFSANVYWIENGDRVLPGMSPAMSAYLGDARASVVNGLQIAVANYNSTESGVEFTLTVSGQNAAALNPSHEYKPHVDSIGVWIRRNAAPAVAGNRLVGGGSAGEIRAFSLAGLRQSGTFTYEAGPVDENDGTAKFHFAVAPHWTGAGIDSIARPLFVTDQTVAHPNSKLPNNPCELRAVQKDARVDTVEVTVSVSEDEPFNEYAQKIKFEFSFEQSMTPTLYELDNVPVRAGAGLREVFPVSNEGFVGAESLVYWRITVIGDPASLISEKQGTFTVGRQRPAPPSNITAVPLGNGMSLSWDPITAADNRVGDLSKSRVIIAYSGSALTAGVDILNFADKLEVSALSSEAVVEGLEPNTDYWFAVALYDVIDAAKPGWNLTSEAAVLAENSGDLITFPNILKITDVTFDTAALDFKVVYELTNDKEADEDVFLSYRVMLGADTVAALWEPLRVRLSVKGDTGSLRIPLGDAIMFDTTYLVSLFRVDADGSPAVGRSTQSVSVGSFTKQTVVVAYNSTRYVDNGRFGVSTAGWDPLAENVTCTTAVVRSQAGSSAAGFVYLSESGYRYTVSAQLLTILPQYTVRMSVNESDIPSPYTLDDVMIYRWTGSFWEVLFDTKYENGYFVGAAGDSVAKDTSTYRLLINEQAPVVMLFADNVNIPLKGSAKRPVVNVDGSFDEDFFVTSNVGNTRVTLYCASANRADSLFLSPAELLSPPAKGTTPRRFRFSVGTDVVGKSGNYGVLSYLVVSNGSHTDTMNISRQVKSPDYSGFDVQPPDDPKTIWLPFAAQVELEQKSIRPALQKRFFESGDEFAIYDTLFRLYRWYPNADNARSDKKWVEYKGDNDDLFALKPGQLMWIKTANFRLFEFGSATTHSLIDTFELKLPPKQWTDFVLPYSFDVCLGDVLAATDAPVELYSWNLLEKGKGNNKQKYYGTKELSLIAPDSSRRLEGGAYPFTIRNSGNDTIVLRVPPRPAVMSRYAQGASGRLAKRADAQPAPDGLWYYTIEAATENTPAISGVMVGYSAAARAFAVPPSFANESVAIVDDDGNGSIGHYFGPDLKSGRTLKLRFYNDGKQKTAFTFSARESGLVPPGTQVTFVNAATGRELSAGPSGYSVTVNGMSHEDVLMVTGGGEYRNKAGAGASAPKFTVSHVSVNQAARSARLKFYIPLAGIDRVEVSIYDIKGRVMWRNTQTVRPLSWNTVEWNSRQSKNGAVSAGLYIVRVKAMDAGGRATAVENRRLTFAR